MPCQSFTINNVSEVMLNKIISELETSGAEIKDNNPWVVKLNQHGIVLKAEWSSEEQKLKITAIDKNFYVSCRKIKKELREKIENARYLI